MKRAANAGIQFTDEQILELSQCEADEGMYMILKTSSCTFSQTQLDDLYFETGNDNVRRKVLEIAQNQGIRLQRVCDEESEEITPQRKHKRPGLLSALFSVRLRIKILVKCRACNLASAITSGFGIVVKRE